MSYTEEEEESTCLGVDAAQFQEVSPSNSPTVNTSNSVECLTRNIQVLSLMLASRQC